MKIKKSGSSKFSETIQAAIVAGEGTVNLGPCTFNQTALITVAGEDIDIAPTMERTSKDGKVEVVEVKRPDMLSARLKALARLLPDGTYNASQKDGVMSWTVA